MPPINRTWYNTLVNDDGSGLTGSIWDKEDVNQLIIATDAAIAAVEPGWQTYTPILSAIGAAWSSANAFAKFRTEAAGARQVTVVYSIEASTLNAAASSLLFNMPTYLPAWGGFIANPCCIFVNGAYEGGWATIPPSDYQVTIVRTGNAAFPAGSGLYVRGQITYPI